MIGLLARWLGLAVLCLIAACRENPPAPPPGGGPALWRVEGKGVDGWLFGPAPTQADISIAVAWGFTQLVAADVIDAAAYPRLAAFSRRAEQHPDFAALPPV